MSGQNLLPQPPAVLSCFKSQFVLLPTDLTAKEPRRRSRSYFGDQNQQGSLVPTGCESSNSSHRLEIPKSLFQLPVTCSEVPQRLPRAQGARCQTLQGIPEISTPFQATSSYLKQRFPRTWNQQGNSCNIFICAVPNVIFSKEFFRICWSYHSYFIPLIELVCVCKYKMLMNT